MPSIKHVHFDVPDEFKSFHSIGMCHQFTVRMIAYLRYRCGIGHYIEILPHQATANNDCARNLLWDHRYMFKQHKQLVLDIKPGSIVYFIDASVADTYLQLTYRHPFELGGVLKHSMICIDGPALMGVNNVTTFPKYHGKFHEKYYQEILLSEIMDMNVWNGIFLDTQVVPVKIFTDF